MKRTWSAEEIKTLISYYEVKPVLWNISSPDYKNREKKSAAVNTLAEQFNTTAFEINRKLHNLRTQFNNELRKLRKKSGEDTVSTWEHFASLSFLMPNTVPANETDGKNSPTRLEDTNKDILESPEPISSKSQSSRRRSKKRKKEDEVLDTALSVIDKYDDAGTFGDFVASAIRNMRSDARKRELKRKIQRIILDIEEKDETDQYSNASSSESSASLDFKYESRK